MFILDKVCVQLTWQPQTQFHAHQATGLPAITATGGGGVLTWSCEEEECIRRDRLHYAQAILSTARTPEPEHDPTDLDEGAVF